MTSVRVGCSGWQYDAWRGRFYPKGLAQRRWLARYAEEFDTVEVNSTFYRLASENGRPATGSSRRPDDFCFTVKASRYLTHIKRLQPTQARHPAVLRAAAAADRRSGKLGPVLWQLPETFQRDDDRLVGALEALPDGPPLLRVPARELVREPRV